MWRRSLNNVLAVMFLVNGLILCPKCQNKNVKSLSIDQGEHDDRHSQIITTYRCKGCGYEFREVHASEWYIERIKAPPVVCEALVYQKLPNKRHRTKRIRFQAPDRAYVEFFRQHPEYNNSGYTVYITRPEHMSCIHKLRVDMIDLDSTVNWLRQRYPDAKDQAAISGHLRKLAQNQKNF
jgi:hypothetical protein